MSSLNPSQPVNTLTFREILYKVRSYSSRSLLMSTLSSFLKVNLAKEGRLALKTNAPNLVNHPFVFFLHLLCYIESQAIDFSHMQCIYVDGTGSFLKGLLQRRFPKALNSIVQFTAFDGLNLQDIAFDSSKFTILFADSLYYKHSISKNDFDVVIFWSSKEEEMCSQEILKTYNPASLFNNTL